MPKATILIVEDEAIVAEDLSRKLGRLGYEVCGITALGEEAVTLARDRRPDLILMDIRLQGRMDGVEAAELIRREHDLPVIFLTAHSDRPTLQRAKLTEPFGYILKPFEELELETHIEMALYKHQAEAKVAADLAALTRMHALSGRMVGKEGLQPLLQEVMDAAVAIVGAERGTLQLLEGNSLRIVAHHRHQPPFLEFFADAENRASVCGEALQRGERVVVPDIEASPLFAGTPSLPVLREAGVRAVQSTPMVSRSGALLGVLTTQWGAPYSPDEHDLWRIDLLVRQAADLIEHARAEELLRASEERHRALTTATSDVLYRMSPDWSEMRQLDGRNFIADTEKPSRTWLQEYIHPDDQSQVKAVINQAIRTKSIFQLEHRVLRVDGTLGWTFSRAIPLQDASGEIVEWFGAASDITKRKRAELNLQASNKELQEWHNVTVGRELRMIELKQEIDALCAKYGEPLRYGYAPSPKV